MTGVSEREFREKLSSLDKWFLRIWVLFVPLTGTRLLLGVWIDPFFLNALFFVIGAVWGLILAGLTILMIIRGGPRRVKQNA